MKPRVSVALAFREKVVRSGRNELGIKKVLSYSAEKSQYSSSNKEGRLSFMRGLKINMRKYMH